MLRFVGYALWADALLTIGLAFLAGQVSANGSVPGLDVHQARLEAAAILRQLQTVPAEAVDEFIGRGAIDETRLRQAATADYHRVSEVVTAYESQVARAAIVRAVADFDDVRLWWTSGALMLVAWLMTRRRRTAPCRGCGVVPA